MHKWDCANLDKLFTKLPERKVDKKLLWDCVVLRDVYALVGVQMEMVQRCTFKGTAPVSDKMLY